MGWSLGGILAGAAQGFGKGVADWAGREIVEEKRINDEVRQEERQIAREGRANAEADRRQDRVQELLDKRELAAKEAMAFEYGAAKESATEAGLKEGTPAYYEHMATFLDTSGNAAGGKEFRAHASKEELVRERLAHVAASRSSRGGGRSGDSEETKADKHTDKLDEQNMKRIGSFGKMRVKGDDGKYTNDDGGLNKLEGAYLDARAAGLSPAQALSETNSVADLARGKLSANKGSDYDAYTAVADAHAEITKTRAEKYNDRANSEAARGANVINSVQSSIPPVGILNGSPDSFVTDDPFGGQRGATGKAQAQPHTTQVTPVGGGTGRGARSGQHTPTQLYVTDKNGTLIPIKSGS